MMLALRKLEFGLDFPASKLKTAHGEADVEADMGEIVDEVDIAEEQEAVFVDAADKGEESIEQSTHQMIAGQVDQVEWQAELERVGPRLKLGAGAGGKEWRAHIQQTRKHEQTIQVVLPEAKGQLEAMGTQVKDAVDKVRSKEKYINAQFEQVKHEYAQQRDAVDKVRSKE